MHQGMVSVLKVNKDLMISRVVQVEELMASTLLHMAQMLLIKACRLDPTSQVEVQCIQVPPCLAAVLVQQQVYPMASTHLHLDPTSQVEVECLQVPHPCLAAVLVQHQVHSIIRLAIQW